MSKRHEQPDPDLERLERPTFEPQIPGPILSQLDEHERWLVSTLSKLEQSTEWNITQHMSVNAHLRRFSSNLINLNKWKGTLSGKTAVIWALGLMITSAGVGAVIKHFLEHFNLP